eukprot:3431556-Pyramimonas_sp.AAC.1
MSQLGRAENGKHLHLPASTRELSLRLPSPLTQGAREPCWARQSRARLPRLLRRALCRRTPGTKYIMILRTAPR